MIDEERIPVSDEEYLDYMITQLLKKVEDKDARLPDDCLDVKGALPGEKRNLDRFNLKNITSKSIRPEMQETLLIECVGHKNDAYLPEELLKEDVALYSIELPDMDRSLIIRTTKLKELMLDNFVRYEKDVNEDKIYYVIKVDRKLLLDCCE